MTWWRRNRWWLVALPVSLALMIGASAYRVRDFWWDAQPRVVGGTAEAGEWLHFADRITGVGADYPVDFKVRMLSVQPASEFESGSRTLPVPEGSDGWDVELEVAPTDPEQWIPCELLLVDAEGRTFGGTYGPVTQLPCRPFDVPDERGHFVTHTVVLVDEGADLKQMRLTFGTAEHLEFQIRH